MGYEAGLPMPDESLKGSLEGWPAIQQHLHVRRRSSQPCSLMDNGRVMLMERGIGRLWPEQTERATIRTWASWARVPEDIKKQMGRWQPSTDEGYERLVKHCREDSEESGQT